MLYRNICLKNLFDSGYIDNILKIAGLEKVREYPEISEMLAGYRKKLKRTLAFSIPFSIGETYAQCVKIDEHIHYQMAWNVSAAKELIRHNGLQVSSFPLKHVISRVDQKCINKSHLEVALQNSSPIIAALYPPLFKEPKFYIIDGNHRAVAKFAAGQMNIPVYVLMPDLHLKAVIGEGYIMLYKIHYNYNLLVNYLGGVITRERMEQSLYPL